MIDIGLPPITPYWGTIISPEVFVVHWGTGYTPTNEAEEHNTLRGYDSFHRNTRGWGGIGYNLLVGAATGNVYKGRGFEYVGAHARGWNYNGYGCCVMGEPYEVTEAIKRGLRAAYLEACAHAGRKLIPQVHRNAPDPQGTECPGDALTAWVMGGGLTDNPPKPTKPVETNQSEKEKNMLFIKQDHYAKGHYETGTGGLYAIVAPGFFVRFTGDDQAKALEQTHGVKFCQVTNSMWDALAESAKHGSNSAAYRDTVDADIHRIAEAAQGA